MTMDNLIILGLGAIGYEVYDIVAGIYNFKRLSEGKRLRRISVGALVSSLTYPKGYFSRSEQL
jgi:hypothetical protein